MIFLIAMTKENLKPKVDLIFTDWVKKIKGSLGKEEWVIVYSSNRSDFEWITFYSALIPNKRIKKSLEAPSWDLHIGNGFPGFVFHFKDGKETGEYYRFSDFGTEPLIFWRSFHSIKEGYYEVSEEFRHYFNLFEDRKNSRFIAIDENGDEEDVILMTEDEIKIKLKYLKEFLAIKKMCLAIFFDFNRFSKKTMEELGIKEFHKIIKKDNYICSIGARNWRSLGSDKRKSHGRLMGKKLIAGLKDFEPKLFNKEKEYEDFIIGVDEEGKEILYTCDPEKLSNYFGRIPGAPHFLTPVFFKKDVLSYYYSKPNKYLVEDGYLRCGRLWGLQMDNNHPKYIVVFLGDLGQRLVIKEQKYWKRFNITPQGGGISRTAWERGFETKFSDPGRSDLYFKQKFRIFQEEWERKFGWKLFRPLSKEDKYHFKTLRIPLTNEQKEFDEQVLSLTKILIDSLNEGELEKEIKITKEKARGIDKLEAFLKSKQVRFKDMFEFLRNLQNLRSRGVAHLKGKKYEKIKKEFSIGEKELSDVLDDILIKAIWTLNSFENYFLKNNR